MKAETAVHKCHGIFIYFVYSFAILSILSNLNKYNTYTRFTYIFNTELLKQTATVVIYMSTFDLSNRHKVIISVSFLHYSM